MMKKFSLLFLLLCIFGTTHAQQLFIEAYSGYNRTIYEDLVDIDPVGYIPIGARVAGGLEHFQVGVEYSKNITNPEFTFRNDSGEKFRKDLFESTYYGAFLRANLSSLPAYRFGLTMAVGAGYYNTTYETYDLIPNESLVTALDYDKILGYNVRIGISAPIVAQLHWEIGYQLNYIERPELLDANNVMVLPGHKGTYHSFQIGLSANLVFGNVEKRCRKVIRTGRR